MQHTFQKNPFTFHQNRKSVSSTQLISALFQRRQQELVLLFRTQAFLPQKAGFRLNPHFLSKVKVLLSSSVENHLESVDCCLCLFISVTRTSCPSGSLEGPYALLQIFQRTFQRFVPGFNNPKAYIKKKSLITSLQLLLYCCLWEVMPCCDSGDWKRTVSLTVC